MQNDCTDSALSYTDSDGARQTIEGCKVSTDRASRIWIWNDMLEQNLAYKAKSVDDALKASINSLLFMVDLKNKEISRLRKIEEMALAFSREILPENEND